MTRLRRWWADKYHQTSSGNPLFERQTVADLEVEMLQDLLASQEDLERQIEQSTDVQERSRLRERLVGVRKALGEQEEQLEDPLIDEWEAEIAAGRAPDMEKGLRP